MTEQNDKGTALESSCGAFSFELRRFPFKESRPAFCAVKANVEGSD
jgi:hypothetical protein